MGLDTIAEGVDRYEAYKFSDQVGTTLAQGGLK
jgi:hypothetical protein